MWKFSKKRLSMVAKADTLSCTTLPGLQAAAAAAGAAAYT